MVEFSSMPAAEVMNALTLRHGRPPPMRAWRPLAPIAVAVAAGVLGVVAVALVSAATPPDQRLWRVLLEGLVIGLPVATGLYATRSRETYRFGILLAGAGLVWSLTALGEASASVPYSIGRVSAWLIFPLLCYLMLAFPDGRLGLRLDRALFGGIVLVVLSFYIGSAPFASAYPVDTPWATCSADCPRNAFLLFGQSPDFLADLVVPLREAVSVLLLVGVIGALAHHRRAAGVLRRRMTESVIAMSALSTALLVAYLVTRRLAISDGLTRSLGDLWALSIPGIAAAFLVGLLRRRAFVGDVLSRLSPALVRPVDACGLRDALAVGLDDPSVELLVPDDETGRWRDAEGRSTTRAAATEHGRAFTQIDDEDGPIAALVHDPALCDDRELLDAICALLLSALRHEHLVRRLARSLADLEESRQRISRAADQERSRIERDLHDGAQQRLIALRIGLTLAEELAERDPAGGCTALRELGKETELALHELRSLTHGVYPAVLSDRGLSDALHSAVSDAPLPIRLITHGVARLPSEIETAVYFTCLEAVQNAFKHACGATGVWISLDQTDRLAFEVRDDGCGFDPSGHPITGGICNMRDRIEAIGGRLTIESAPGRGTRVRGEVPLGAATTTAPRAAPAR